MTGHGCFRTFLKIIGKRESDTCVHCMDDVEDSLEHTVFNCPAWSVFRETLFESTEQLSSLKDLVGQMVSSSESWDAFNAFANAVISCKEECDRIEEQEELDELCNSMQVSVPVNLVDGDSDLD